MFHESDGWHFERIENGGVRIVKTSNCLPPDGDNVAEDHTIEPEAWCSIVASVSPQGGTAISYDDAVKLHIKEGD